MTNLSNDLAREHWIRESHFHPLDQAQVLNEIASQVTAAIARDGRARIFFDLDSTLYDVAPRTQAILRDWAYKERRRMAEVTIKAVDAMEIAHVGYSLRDTFEAMSLDVFDPEVESDLRNAREFWWPRFFSDDYLKHDLPSAGAVAYANRLKSLGAELIYLTGRMAPEMARGTRRNLERDGFPVDPASSRVVMKDSPDRPDIEHKVNASKSLGAENTVVASFENEPLNLMAMQDALPKTWHVFVNTVCSDNPAPVGRELYRIRDFIHS